MLCHAITYCVMSDCVMSQCVMLALHCLVWNFICAVRWGAVLSENPATVTDDLDNQLGIDGPEALVIATSKTIE